MTFPRPGRFSQRPLLFLALALAGACGDSQSSPGGTPAGGGAGATSAGGGAGSTAQAGSSAEAGPGGTGTSQGGTGGAANAAGGSAGQDPSGSSGSGAETLPGRLARYHHTDTDRSLHFELDAVQGLSPRASSLDYLGEFFGRVLDKPDGVVFDTDETLEAAGSDHVYTFDELDAYARAHTRDDATGPVSIHVLFLDGSYDSGDGGTVLGLAWGQRQIALFQDAIRSGCSGGLLGSLSNEACEVAERNVWAHEIGHVIGLVDNGLAQQTNHRDSEHGRHDVSDDCLMYWAYDSPAMFDVLLSRLDSGESMDVDFCENCWADLNAARH
ncbi:MAG TPA: hypothetical protein VMG12_41615 [Polyangiaceae bacterium]|nr:hypothetical protein [Polyangiaceae bacterium]